MAGRGMGGATRERWWHRVPGASLARTAAHGAVGTPREREAARDVYQDVSGFLVRALSRGLRRDEVPPGDFAQVLWCWGLRDEEIPRVYRGLMVECIGFAVLGAVSVVSLFYWSHIGWQAVLPSASVLGMAVMGTATRLWRAEVLRRREWVPFGSWLLGA